MGTECKVRSAYGDVECPEGAKVVEIERKAVREGTQTYSNPEIVCNGIREVVRTAPLRATVARSLNGTPFREPIGDLYSTVICFVRQDKNFVYDQQARRVMRRALTKDSNCVDVGANVGSFLKQIVKVAPRGRHQAFEPIPALAEKLAKRFPAVEVHDCALSDSSGETVFQYVKNCPGYSGMRRRDYDFGEPEIEEIRVPMCSLDSIIAPGGRVDMIKIDVEGAELLVMKGARRTIQDNKPLLLFEHGLGGADHYGTTPEQTYDFVCGECGMRIFLMADWLAGREPLSRERMGELFRSGKEYFYMACA
jgi:FkbM family methyltransferase